MAYPSAFLNRSVNPLKSIVRGLAGTYDFVSILATDCSGVNFESFSTERRVAESSWSERGFVLRGAKNGRVVEHSFDTIPPDLNAFITQLDHGLARLLSLPADAGTLSVDLGETAWKDSFVAETDQDPLALGPEEVFDRLDAIRERTATAHPLIAMARTRGEWARFSKLYVSQERELFQSYLWGQAYIFAAARREGKTRQTFSAVSGRKGMALLEELEGLAGATADQALELLDAIPMPAGEYTVVLSPDMAGLLAHEAFGHGVETDMIVRGRAKARDYMGKRVASDRVSLYDGARSAEQTGSYHFDDEGTPGSSTLILDRGILVSGISDLLSARELGIPATGNGRRWSFERKAYARMTNTFFAPGASTREELIQGVAYGWLLDRPNSGMEDPKNWGIQLVALVGREIKDGKLTGRIASPVVCTGYVPEVLNAVDGVSETVELKGNGYCGKGHKEFVKVSSGGPWVRTKMRLG